MDTKSVFAFSSYKSYMKHVLRQKGARGSMSRAAEALNCQRSYLSRVMDSEIQLTPDQAYLFCRHRKLPSAEREYFATLVEHERASDRNYRDHLETKISELRSSNELLAQRLKRPPPITSGAQDQTYFSTWQYSAIHFMTACRSFQSAEVIAQRLSLPLTLVHHILQELASWGMVRDEGARWQYADGSFHLPKNSPLVIQHHQNWRARAVLDAQLPGSSGLHFTNVQTVGKSDLPALNERLVQFIDDCKEILDPSPDEELVAITCDVFKV